LGVTEGAGLEAGRRLTLLKEREPHGDWLRICEERVGLSVRTAQRLMQAAAKYLSPPLAPKSDSAIAFGGHETA